MQRVYRIVDGIEESLKGNVFSSVASLEVKCILTTQFGIWVYQREKKMQASATTSLSFIQKIVLLSSHSLNDDDLSLIDQI